jgi:hypothetical protein
MLSDVADRVFKELMEAGYDPKRAHVDGCPACREEHESLRALVSGDQLLSIAAQSTDSRSTTKTSGSCGFIAPPAPRAP